MLKYERLFIVDPINQLNVLFNFNFRNKMTPDQVFDRYILKLKVYLKGYVLAVEKIDKYFRLYF